MTFLLRWRFCKTLWNQYVGHAPSYKCKLAHCTSSPYLVMHVFCVTKWKHTSLPLYGPNYSQFENQVNLIQLPYREVIHTHWRSQGGPQGPCPPNRPLYYV